VAGIFREDELVLEAQQRAIDDRPGQEFHNLNIDAGAMWARRLIDQLIAKEQPAAAAIPIRPVAVAEAPR
jgi:vanillate O-demethylase monooxygenase subunit